MDASDVTNLCKAIIDPLLEKLASKDDIDTFVKFIEGHFKDELKLRDDKIAVLQSKNAELETRMSAIEKGLQRQRSDVEPSAPLYDYSFPDRADAEDRPKIDMLLIGDSNVRFLNTENINPGKENELDCTGGGKIPQIRENLIEFHDTHDIREAVIHVGSNHIPNDSPNELADKLESFLKAAKSAMPNTSLHFSAILPKLDNSFLPGINIVNEHIYSVCQALNIGFIQYPSFARYGFTNYYLFGRDKIHTNPRGQAIMCNNIRKAITK